MEPYQIIIVVVLAIIVLVTLLYWVLTRRIAHRRRQTVQTALQSLFSDNIIRPSDVSYFDFAIEQGRIRYEIKILPFDLKHELIITNPTYWCINADLKNWRRSTIPTLVPGVKEFMNYRVPFEGSIIKMGLIYPDCYNITRYLNESDVATVRFTDCVYGAYFVKFSEMASFFSKVK